LERVGISNPPQRIDEYPHQLYVKMNRILLPGEVANPANLPSGCAFHPRCTYAQERCRVEEPAWQEVTPKHFALCHFVSQLELSGVVED
jgi:peptide/nickel transport system ATP-binding protein